MDFERIVEKVNVIAASASLVGVTATMSNVSALLDVMPSHEQREMSEVLMRVIEDARKYDAEIA